MNVDNDGMVRIPAELLADLARQHETESYPNYWNVGDHDAFYVCCKACMRYEIKWSSRVAEFKCDMRMRLEPYL